MHLRCVRGAFAVRLWCVDVRLRCVCDVFAIFLSSHAPGTGPY